MHIWKTKIKEKKKFKNIEKNKNKVVKSYKYPKKGCKGLGKKNIKKWNKQQRLQEEKEGKETTFYLKT